MLDAVEIKNLEKRWLRWKMKSILKKSVIILLFLAILPISWGIYNIIPTMLNPTKKDDITIAKEEAKKIVQPQQNIEEDSLYADNKPVTQEIKPINTPKETYYTEDDSIDDSLYEDELPNEKTTQNSEFPTDEYIELEQIDDYEETVKPQPKQKPKPKINIETSVIEKHKDLREKFEETKDIVFALMLAEEHYHDKDYKDALRWSIIANNIDYKNERSWIIFAKSMAKNGSPDKAINALKEYLKQNPNASKIEAIINNIRSGNY